MPLSYQTLWISDVHLGTPACRAPDLLRFLDCVEAERLYLVGDIIDLERMKLRPAFPDSHWQVLRRLLELARRGTEVIYIPGNHDCELRDLIGRDVVGVPVAMDCAHETRDGRRLLVTHGDILDREIRCGTNLEAFGATAYRMVMQLDVMVNQLRTRLGRDHFSISSRIKQRIASAQQYIQQFEAVAANYAARRGFDGIVCGHIHRPGIRGIDGVLYANDGDWVEHRTALAERRDGRLELLSFERDNVVVDSLENAAPVAA